MQSSTFQMSGQWGIPTSISSTLDLESRYLPRCFKKSGFKRMLCLVGQGASFTEGVVPLTDVTPNNYFFVEVFGCGGLLAVPLVSDNYVFSSFENFSSRVSPMPFPGTSFV